MNEPLILRKWIGRFYTSATAWATFAMLLRVTGFMLVMVYALRKLDPEKIGYWYVISAIAGFAATCEFGFSQTISRFASYFHGGASVVPALGLEPQACGREPNYPALAGLLAQARRLYSFFGFGVTVLVLISGAIRFWFASIDGIPRPVFYHASAFIILAVGSGMNMATFFWPPVLFGIGKVRLTNQLQILGYLVYYAISFAGLACRLGVLALVLGHLALYAVAQSLSARRVAALIPANDSSAVVTPISWRNLWPMSWRTGLVNLTSFVSIQATPLLCSWIAPLGQTANYGLSLQLALLLHGFAANWITVYYPHFSTMLARGETAGVAILFRRRLLLVMGTYILIAAGAFLIGPFALRLLGTRTNFLPSPQLAALLGILGWHLVVGVHADLLRSQNRAPHLPAFIVTAILTAALGGGLGRLWGVSGLLAGEFLALGIFSGWWTPWRCWQDLREIAGEDHPGIRRSQNQTKDH